MGDGSNAASTSDDNGRSAGESSAESSTGDRFTKSTQGVLGRLGPVGGGVAAGLGMVTSMGAKAAGLLTDQTNQAGVGQNTYGPDFSAMGSNSRSDPNGQGDPNGLGPGRHPHGDNDSDDPQHGGGTGGGGGDQAPPVPPTPSSFTQIPAAGGPAPAAPDSPPRTPAATGGGAGGGAAGGAAGGAGAGAAGGAAVPPVA